MRVSNAVAAAAAFIVCALSSGGTFAAERNACGCYQTAAGTCACQKKARCGCPGQCEPQGCDAKREKAFQKELDSETRKARQAEKRHPVAMKQEAPKAAPEPARRAPPISPGQAKALAKLLDRYFAAHPAAREQTAGALRNGLSSDPGGR